ncbi:Uncharacterized protein SCF082_LOCUS10856 [Durusdinium trenchii]|uniref:Uncharacterized protein n=1 Tax=Durusdinium trenchii TaxID=1381693 RepID=A0ABP0J940_9DINO
MPDWTPYRVKINKNPTALCTAKSALALFLVFLLVCNFCTANPHRYGKREGFSNLLKKKVHDAVENRNAQTCSLTNVPNKCLRCQRHHLQQFREEMPHKKVYDLSANVHVRRRTENADNTLPCLTTSSQLWSEKRKRLMLGSEQLQVLGFPAINGLSACAQEPVNLDDYTEASLRKMAGNGMSVPCAGFVMLMAVLAISDV